MLNKVGSKKIPLPQTHLLLRFEVYRDSYLDTNPKIAIYHDTFFRGDTHPYVWYYIFVFVSRYNISMSYWNVIRDETAFMLITGLDKQKFSE